MTTTDTSKARFPVLKHEIMVRTVMSRADYRVTIKGPTGKIGYRFMLHEYGEHVMIYTKSSCLGGFALKHFGGSLTPDGIRDFVTTYVRM